MQVTDLSPETGLAVEAAAAPITYELVFESEFRSITRDVYYILGDRDGAIDVAEEAFTRLAQHWPKVSRYDRPGAWVRRVAIRIAVRNRMKKYREVGEYVPEQSVAPIDPIYIDVRNAVMKLPRTQRAAIILHYYHDLLIEEVANILGCRVNTVKAHLFKARARLKQLLAGVINDE
jgi:RNA polymerase sigma factor (sigma-70 family)